MSSLLKEQNPKLQEFFWQHLFQFTKDAVFIYEIIDEKPSNFLEANHVACEILGYSHDELMQLTPFDIYASTTIKQNPLRFFIKTSGTTSFETDLIKKSGEVITTKVISQIAIIHDRKIVISTVQDPTTSIYYDPITRLYSRRYIINHLPKAIEHARTEHLQLNVLILNIDHFRLLNHDFGYSMSDDILKEVSSRICSSMNDIGTVAYMGKDEFMILFYSINTEIACEVAESLLRAIEKPINFFDEELHLTASIGLSCFPDHADVPSDLMNYANIALDQAKKLGGNQYSVYDTSMKIHTPLSQSLLNRLHKAIDDEEFILHFQPRVDTKTNKLIGAEALTRWHHPEKGIIPPSTFIPLAEKSTVIIDLGKWVIKKVCMQIKEWLNRCLPPLTISINLSARQLEDPSFIPSLKQILSQTGVESRFLEFEITESMIVKDSDTVRQNLFAIKDMGIHISIDDFGTGYSSLSRLQKLPIDCIKIDRAFIQDLHINANAHLVTSIIELGHNLQLKVVAEGVENEDQLTFIKERKCDEWQGFLYSKPLPVDQFEKLLASIS